jgi:hypothetical protein
LLINNSMIVYIDNLENQYIKHVQDDPVRPEIPAEFRVDVNRFVLAEADGDTVRAMVCISLQDSVPVSVSELGYTGIDIQAAIFYTIWSYSPGAGAKLLLDAVSEIQHRYPEITRFVTLSPKTLLARKFHLRNGAVILRENQDTVNYEYLVTPV